MTEVGIITLQHARRHLLYTYKVVSRDCFGMIQWTRWPDNVLAAVELLEEVGNANNSPLVAGGAQ